VEIIVLIILNFRAFRTTINFPFVELFKRKIVSFGYCCCVLGASHFYIFSFGYCCVIGASYCNFFSFGYSFGAIPPSKTAHFVYASAVILLIEIASFVFKIL
jgi:hypothetical protein